MKRTGKIIYNLRVCISFTFDYFRVKMKRIQDKAKQLLLDRFKCCLDVKKELLKSSFQAWELEIATHVQTLESVTSKQLVNNDLT